MSALMPAHTWMDQWTHFEARLSRWLLLPHQQENAIAGLMSLQKELRQLLQDDTDSSLYWLLQLAATSSVGYSASHATVCASLCALVAPALNLSESQCLSLTLAALSMNVAMTQLQDALTTQAPPPSPAQRLQIDMHAAQGAELLQGLGVTDLEWLYTVKHHHDQPPAPDLLTRTLVATDRYAALLSPRETRSGRCVTDSARGVVARQGSTLDDVGHALVRTIGICPPGTFVRLEDERVAVVLRRGGDPGTPWVAPVLDATGLPIAEPELIHTGQEGQGIEAALITQTVRVRLNHVRLLELSRQDN